MTATYPNGRIPLSNLTVTSIGVRLRSDAAASIERMAGAFRRDVGHALLASDGYRAMDGPFGQIAIFEDRYPSLTSLGVNDRRGTWTRTSHPSLGARWWYRRPRAAAAAVPGTSVHGNGLACDFAAGVNAAGTAAHRWMNQHGPDYGWIWPAWAQRAITYEPWHREYDPARDKHAPSGGGGSTVRPTPPTSEEDDMYTDEDRAKLNYVFNALAQGESGVRPTGHVLAQLSRIENALSNLPKAAALAVWGFVNERLEKRDAYSIFRSIRDRVGGAK